MILFDIIIFLLIAFVRPTHVDCRNTKSIVIIFVQIKNDRTVYIFVHVVFNSVTVVSGHVSFPMFVSSKVLALSSDR